MARSWLVVAVAAVALVAAACSGGSKAPAAATTAPGGTSSAATAAATTAATTSAATAAPTTAAAATVAAPAPAAVPGTSFGIAGLVPAHFPSPTADDWKAFYASIPSLGGWLGAYFGYDAQSGIAPAALNQIKASRQQGFQALANIGFNHDAAGKYNAAVDFSVPSQVQAYTAALVALAKDTQPPFLGIGNEVNRLWEENQAAYNAFAKAVPGIVQAIHQASPQTKVFVTFQYEFMRGGGKLSGQTHQPEWALLDQLAPALDVVGFTTYPYFDYASPSDVPANYYQDAQTHAGKPIGFTEIGWPDAPIAGSDLGGTPAEQAAFVQRLPALFKGANPVFAMWSFAYDSPALGVTFGSLGLSANDGTPHPALAAWKQIDGAP